MGEDRSSGHLLLTHQRSHFIKRHRVSR
jgi:hypothetical protein